MKKVNTKAEVITIVDPDTGLKTRSWKKVCPICGKEYTTTSRSQKFCSNECCKKAQIKKRKQQKEYNATKEIVRLSARSHSLAVETLAQLVRLGVREYKCECCGTTEEVFQVHHKNLSWLDNTPGNLMYVCPKCHAELHSKLEAELKEQGKTLEDFYPEDFKPLLAVLNKNLQ